MITHQNPLSPKFTLLLDRDPVSGTIVGETFVVRERLSLQPEA